MYCSQTIAVVIPTYNEENFVTQTIQSIPSFVDLIIVVDDASSDSSLQAINNVKTDKIHIVKHKDNLGVGAATISGYRKAVQQGADIVAVMDGDGQMDPKDLHKLLDTLIMFSYDYVKGNRFLHSSISNMPRLRYIGNTIFSNLTSYALNLPFTIDTQCGYTAITSQAIKKIALDKLYPRYGFLNNLLFELSAQNLSIGTVPVHTIYGKEISGINPLIVVPTIFYITLSGYLQKLFFKYNSKLTQYKTNKLITYKEQAE